MNKCNDFFKIVKSDIDESTTLDALKNACEIVQKDYSHDEIFSLLAADNDFAKPYIILCIKELNNKMEADILMNHLTGVDGRIREAVSIKLCEFAGKYDYFCDEFCINELLKGILDINPNVVRNVIETIKKNKHISNLIEEKIKTKIYEILENLKQYCSTPYKENKIKNTKNHAKNKQVFSLYWLLEAIGEIDFKDDEKLKSILYKTSDFLDYTIREKSAKIVSKMHNPPSKLLQKLKNDENFYVKNLVYDKIN